MTQHYYLGLKRKFIMKYINLIMFLKPQQKNIKILINSIMEMRTYEDFKKELDEYLKSIKYDEMQLYKEMN